MNVKIKDAIIVGMLPAVLEGLLIHYADPTTSNWILVQSILFWFTCGFTVYLIEVGLHKVISGILFTVFLSLPWYIAEPVSKNKPEHLLPLIMTSIIMGLLIGLLSKKLNAMNKKNE